MELRNFEKLKPFIEAYNNGEIIYIDGALYRTVKRLNQHSFTKLDKPEIMRISSTRGYWRVSIQGNVCYEHVVIYAIFHGMDSLKNIECIDHIDTNKSNNRIDNLDGVTIEENNKRAKEKGLLQDQRGARNNASKISDDVVLEIRNLYAEGMHTQRELAGRFGISQATVSQIVARKRRRDV